MDVAVLLITLALSSTILGEEVFENSTHICQRCTCIDKARFTLDCQNQTFHNTIAEWPKHDVPLLATFSFNNIVHLELLPQSDKVIDLVFSHCNIKSMDNGVFKAVRDVQFVDLSFNALTTEEIGPEKFKGPYNESQYEPLNINHLDLSYNQIHSLPHNIFKHLHNLRQLNLEGNHFKVLDIPTQTALSSVVYLESLNLANNELTELVGDAVKSLSNLKQINLAFNKLDAVPETLSYIGNSLKFLNLDSNPIFELTDESFLGIKTVIQLTLTNLSRLTYVHANTFAPIERLKILYLHTNKNLFGINAEAFGPHQVIEELYLQDNALTNLSYNLTNWFALKLLNLSGNQFYCSCDVYKIGHDLTQQITEDKDGPVCVDYITGKSTVIYELKEQTCVETQDGSSYHLVIEKHFFVAKLFIAFMICLLLICFMVTVTVFSLRLRRYRMNRNYHFATQVCYNNLSSVSA